jgi:hypothetical protein
MKDIFILLLYTAAWIFILATVGTVILYFVNKYQENKKINADIEEDPHMFI